MKDRIPTYPGRVRMTPVQGQENVYDMERADAPTQVGTPLNKETLLTDDVAELFGGDDTWTPNDLLTSYKLYRWKKYSINYTAISYTPTYDYRTGSSDYTYYMYFGVRGTTGTATVVKYGDSYTVDNNGNTTIVNPTTLTISPVSNSTDYLNMIAPLKTKYFKITTKGSGTSANLNTTDLYYMSNSIGQTYNGDYWCIYRTSLTAYKQRFTPVDLEEEVTSENANEYPVPTGKQGGYYYSYVGRRIDTVKSGIKAEVGSYVGTGNTTRWEPAFMEFEGEPLLIIIKTNGSDYSHMFPCIGITSAFENYGYMFSWSGLYFRYRSDDYSRKVGANRVEWYGSDSVNTSGTIYYYLAFYR